MTRIKICGITNAEDARAAVDYGADALGFIFVPGTPRFVNDATETERVLSGLPPFVARVGVCLEPSQIPATLARRLTAIQFYSDDWKATAPDNMDLVRALRIHGPESLEKIEEFLEPTTRSLAALLLDTFHKDRLGGSGETFNWELAVAIKRRFDVPLILAGGLTPENVADAIHAVRPYAVDASSGVEAEPGRKDHGKLKAFIRAARRADSCRDRQ